MEIIEQHGTLVNGAITEGKKVLGSDSGHSWSLHEACSAPFVVRRLR